MLSALIAEAKRLSASGKTPLGPWTHEPTYGAPGNPRWTVRDGRGVVVCLVHGSEETARMIAALPEFLDDDLGHQRMPVE